MGRLNDIWRVLLMGGFQSVTFNKDWCGQREARLKHPCIFHTEAVSGASRPVQPRPSASSSHPFPIHVASRWYSLILTFLESLATT